MMKLWKWYENCLAVHPVKTQVISSGFLWGVGDIAAQSISHSTAKKHLHIRVSTVPVLPVWCNCIYLCLNELIVVLSSLKSFLLLS